MSENAVVSAVGASRAAKCPFQIRRDGGYVFDDPVNDFERAMELADGIFDQDGDPSTVTVEDADERVIASFTNRKVVGVMRRQTDGPRDTLVPVGEDEFDATDFILLMDAGEIRKIMDNDETSDDIGRAHVTWDDPCDVEIVESICEFFGIDSLEDLTDENVAFARAQRVPTPLVEKTVTLTVRVDIRALREDDVSAFLRNLNCAVESRTPGVFVMCSRVGMRDESPPESSSAVAAASPSM